MAYTDFGNLYPSEAGFKTPGMYGAFLQAEGAKRAAYLSDMDQFFANLTETTRRFNEELGFKQKELTSRETISREEMDLRRELQDEQLEYQRWMIGQTTASQEKIAAMRTQQPNYLGGPSSREIFNAWVKKNQGGGMSGEVTPGQSGIKVYQSGTNKNLTVLTPEEETLARSRAAGSYGSVNVEPGWYRPSRDYEQTDYYNNYGQSASSGVANYKDWEDWG